jgi:hypothetical protein
MKTVIAHFAVPPRYPLVTKKMLVCHINMLFNFILKEYVTGGNRKPPCFFPVSIANNFVFSSWLKHYATIRKVAGSIRDAIGFFS